MDMARNITLSNRNESLKLPKLVFGAGNLSDMQQKEHYFALLDAFYAAGGRCIDTARYYGFGISERIIGEWLRTRAVKREEILLVTKGGFPEVGDMHASRLTKPLIEQDLSESLADLGVDYVDVYLLHRDNLQQPASVYVDILDELVKSGRIRFGGVSNWTGARISEANDYAMQSGKHPISVSQINFSLAVTTPDLLEDDTLVCMNQTEAAFYQNSGLPLMAYAALAKGYFPKLAAEKPLPLKAQKRYDSPQNRNRFQALKAYMMRHKLTATPVVLAYLTCHSIQTAAVFSCSQPQQVTEAMTAADVQLTADDIKQLACEA